jgi:hypothetical protein
MFIDLATWTVLAKQSEWLSSHWLFLFVKWSSGTGIAWGTVDGSYYALKTYDKDSMNLSLLDKMPGSEGILWQAADRVPAYKLFWSILWQIHSQRLLCIFWLGNKPCRAAKWVKVSEASIMSLAFREVTCRKTRVEWRRIDIKKWQERRQTLPKWFLISLTKVGTNCWSKR